jgi:hypothetical protein
MKMPPHDGRHQHGETPDEQHIGRRIGEAARGPFLVLNERGAEQRADRDRDEEQN